MKLVNPFTGLLVDAPSPLAERLMEKGFTKPKPVEKKAPRKRAPRKTDKTE